ncbi:Putative NADH:ubiquinone oxidoreductase, subunit RnfA [Georgfuchsia toluolica]|uniref:NADH:ubiquinone oxidoreductase, subunit RnfA n=1 Tax=Georgfuchsia toluolica TaxID=424218 RepID=A0A916J530_9PROT|nr:Rnf-Nqr domain containing protein [Georgfuchsia toluolica]CAG4883573.1 Putative NADH:ubiquinone oxidoreductase, subunit RnfA [Georgfuchsia toluolica]
MADATVVSSHEVLVEGALPVDVTAIRLVRSADADLPLAVVSVKPATQSNSFVLTTAETLNKGDHYQLTVKGVGQSWEIAPSPLTLVISVIIGSALINNFVFTRYLGLCVFFGVSKNKDTAIGMGITFTIVGVLSGMIAWALNTFALVPLKLEFMQIIAFIGIVACLVQATDLILKKVNPILHKKFGIYLVLITTNCIILAVPLLNATSDATMLQAFGLSLGAGAGFALAMFLMSCAVEKVNMAPVPLVFKGLPVAFIIAGLFALSFLGFSGLKVA